MAEEVTTAAQKVLFTDDQIANYSKFLDGLFDFKKLITKKYKVFLLFKIDVGSLLEKYDRTVYENIFKVLNNLYAEGKIDDNLGQLIISILKAWDDVSMDELVDTLAKEIAGKVDVLDNDTQETAFIKALLSALATLKPDLLTSLHAEYLKVQAQAE